MTGDLLKIKLRNDTDYSSTGVVEFLQPLLDEFLTGHPEHVQAMFHNLPSFFSLGVALCLFHTPTAATSKLPACLGWPGQTKTTLPGCILLSIFHHYFSLTTSGNSKQSLSRFIATAISNPEGLRSFTKILSPIGILKRISS